ncbi:MAG: AEC family transporter, partial [Dictyoglomus sp.]
MENFISAFQGVLEIVILIFIGYILAYKKWFDIKTADLFAKLVLNISLPFNMIVNITSFFQREELIKIASGLIIPFSSMSLSFIIGYILASLLKIERGKKGVLVGIFSLSNSIFIGLPMSQALFGEIAIPFTLLYYMANTTIWWSAGVYIIAIEAQKDARLFSLNTLVRIFNIPFL